MDDWSQIAQATDPDDVRERILTGYRAGKPFTPYVPTIALPQPLGAVLDFGCGLGRNFPYLTAIAREVIGFDLPPMVERCRALADQPVALLTSDWDLLCSRRFDLIVATLVLQHIDAAACDRYVRDAATIAPAMYLLSSVRSDDDVNVLDAILKTGCFESGPCVAVEHDERTHQLRVIGTRAADEVRTASDGGHYEVLLRSTRFAR